MFGTIRRNKHIVFCEIMPWLWRAIHIFSVFVADDRIPSSNNWRSICEHILKKYWTPPQTKCCMCMVHFMTSKTVTSCAFINVFMPMKMKEQWKNEKHFRKSSVNRSCSTTFVTNEMWSHQTWVSNKVSLTSTYRFFKCLSQLEDTEIKSPWDKLPETGNS